MSGFSLKFLNANADNIIPFLPYGVTTIEFALEGTVPDGDIRPENCILGDDDERFVGFVDGNKDFLVVWGAGKEKGQHVCSSTIGRMFMQLIHLKNSHEHENVTFIHSGKFAWRQKVGIVSAINDDVVRMRFIEDGVAKRILFEGSKVPLYYSRWFPPKPLKGEKIEYIDIEYPRISIEYEEDTNGITSQFLSVFLHTQDQKKKICSVRGDLKYSKPHAELFALIPDQGLFVLRLWFYWIHKRFEGNFFYNLEEINEVEKDYLKLGQQMILEIPDIERFDFVIDAKQGKITWYGTDFHYQEYWGRIKEDLADACIAHGIDLVFKTIDLFPFRLGQQRDNYNPIEKLKQIITDEKQQSELKFIVLDVVEKKPAEKDYLALNIRTHIPYVKNGETEKNLNLISSVVSNP